MSAETIPAEVRDIADRFATDAGFIAGGENSDRIARAILTDRSTRPAEPAATVDEAGDGEVVAWEARFAEAVEIARDKFAWKAPLEVVELQSDLLALLRDYASTLEAERARADAAEQERDWQYEENVARIAAQGAAEQRAADALARAEKAKGALDVDAAMALIEGALKWANWCAGEGICAVEGEGVIDPDTLLLAYSQSTDDEDWETLHERLPALFRASREAQPATDGGEA